MKSWKIGRIVLLVLVGLFIAHVPFSCQRIDAGHAGIKVNLYGNEKGVDEIHEVTGMTWFNPYTHQVFEVPTFVQTATYMKNDDDGMNHEFNITTKDGINVQFDISINYYTPYNEVVSIFEKYRKPVSELEDGVLRNFIKDAFNNVANNYTAEGLYNQRAEFEAVSEKRLTDDLATEGFIVEQVVILGQLRFPKNVEANIEAKVNAEQLALAKQQEVQQAIFDAQKAIEKMKGDSTVTVGLAAADAFAYQMRNEELTDLLIQEKFLDTWDGKLPVYGESPMLFKDIANK